MENTTKRTHNKLANLLLIAIFLMLDILAAVVSNSLGWTIAAAILGFVGLYALIHDISLFGSTE